MTRRAAAPPDIAAVLDTLGDLQMNLTRLAQSAREAKDPASAKTFAAQARLRRQEAAALRRSAHAAWSTQTQIKVTAKMNAINLKLQRIVQEADRATLTARRLTNALSLTTTLGTLLRKVLP